MPSRTFGMVRAENNPIHDATLFGKGGRGSMEPRTDQLGQIIRIDRTHADSSSNMLIAQVKAVNAPSTDTLVAERHGDGAMTGIFRGLAVGFPITVFLWGAILWVLVRFIS